MKEKTKDTSKNGKTIFKKWWIILGIVILAWTIFWFIFVRILNHYAFIINVMLLVIGYCLLINYILITLIYWGVKILQKDWKIEE